MLLFREKVPAEWLSKVLGDIPAVLVDHAHLERKAATSALNLEKYRALYPKVEQLNAIAIEELQHFQLVLDLLKRRGIPFSQPRFSPWISGLMRSVRNGVRQQVIDHLICAAFIEGRSCRSSRSWPRVAAGPNWRTYATSSSPRQYYATYILMAREIDDSEWSPAGFHLALMRS